MNFIKKLFVTRKCTLCGGFAHAAKLDGGGMFTFHTCKQLRALAFRARRTK